MKNTRIFWIDNVKIIAITLVALGHLLQGLIKAGILANGTAFNLFDTSIYYFHVPLFFICSGFLFQKFTKENNAKEYFKLILKKLIALGVPYFVFSLITYAFKAIFADSVNTENAGLIDCLFVHPTAPYWFLFTLFFIFIITPVLKSKADAIIRIVFCLALYFVSVFVDFSQLPDAIETILYYICHYSIWFSLGSEIAFFNLDSKFKAWHIVFFAIFAILAIIGFFKSFSLPLVFGILACVGITSFVGAMSKNGNSKVLCFISKYIMPIFLMHTIFCAGARSVLLKIGITNAPIHIIVGLITSFCLPVFAGMIMEKIKLDILYNPTKYIKIK